MERAAQEVRRLLRTAASAAREGRERDRLRLDLERLVDVLALARDLAEPPPSGRVFSLVMGAVDRILRPDACTLYLAVGSEQGLLPVATNGPSPLPDAVGAAPGPETDLVRAALRSSRPETARRGGSGEDSVHRLAVPMLRGGRPFGALAVCRNGSRPFDGGDTRLISLVARFTADAMTHSALQEEADRCRRRLNAVERHVEEGLVFLDAGGRVSRLSPPAARILGVRSEAAVGRPIHALLFAGRTEAKGMLRDLATGATIGSVRTVAREAAGAPIPVEVTGTPLGPGDGGGTLFVVRDLSGTAAALEGHCRVDPLTGLLNQLELRPALRAELHRARDTGRPLSLALLLVEGLREINRDAGHGRGDRVLRRVAGVVRSRLRRQRDQVFRMGGGEVVILLPGTGRDRAARVVRRIIDAVRASGTGAPVRIRSAVTQASAADTADGLFARLSRGLG